MSDNLRRSLKIFYCYALDDQELLKELNKHLNNMMLQGQLASGYSHEVKADKNWVLEIDKQHIDASNIILLLISPDFMGTKYSYSEEMKYILKRNQEGKAHIIPIILRPVEYEGAPFSYLQILPSNEKPITSWSNRDKAFLDVVEGIKRVVQEIRANDQTLFEAEVGPFSQREDLFKENLGSIHMATPSTDTIVERFQESTPHKAMDYEAISPTIERLSYPPDLLPEQQKSDQSIQTLEKNKAKGTSDIDLASQKKSDDIVSTEKTTQLHLPFAETTISSKQPPSRKPRKPSKDGYEKRHMQAQRFYLKNQPHRGLDLLKDLDFEPIPSSQRWRIAALRGHCYFGLGMFLPAKKDYIYAIEEMPEAIPQEQVQDAMLVHLHLAYAERELGNLPESAQQYNIALARMNADAQIRHFAEAYWGLALVNLEQFGKFHKASDHVSNEQAQLLREALIYAEKAKALFESAGEMLNAASVACDIAFIHQTAGHLDQARKNLEDILEIWTPMLHTPENTTTNKKRLKQYRNVVSAAACYLANVELEAQNHREALAYAELGQKIAEHSNTLRKAEAATTVGKVLTAQNPYDPGAEKAFRQALDILQTTDLLAAQIQAHTLLGNHLLKLGRAFDGKRELDEALRISLRAQGISSSPT